MSVSRQNAVVNAQLKLILEFRYDDSGVLFDPNEVSQVEIIDATDGTTILETIASGAITKLATGTYQVITSISWNTTTRSIIDRWTYKKESGGDDEFAESSAVISDTSGLPSETTIVTLAETKSFLKIDDNDSDTQLNLLLGKCTSYIETLMNRIISQTTYKQLYDGNGGYNLLLDNYPVISVGVLSVNTTLEDQQYDSALSASQILVHDRGNVELFDEVFTSGQKTVYIEYSAGYEDAPADLKLVVLNTIGKKFYDIDEKRLGISQRNIMTENINFVIEDISSTDKEVLRRYKKPARARGVSVTGWTAK